MIEEKNAIGDLLKQPSTKYAIIIAIVVIGGMYATQSLWINAGIKIIYNEYTPDQLNDISQETSETLILVGNYNAEDNTISNGQSKVYVDMNVNCKPSGGQYVKMLVIKHSVDTLMPNVNHDSRITVLKVLDGC